MKSELFLLFLVLIGALLSTALTHPSKPLNERSTELAWQAWLLVDQSSQKSSSSDMAGQLRRRITPKSVFIAPTFSPDSLPACADGYRSDSMGRCVKIIKIDESVHLEFLLQKLNEQFSDYEELDEELDVDMQQQTTQGPFQVNIPLDLDDEAADMAIVVAPNMSARKDSVKFDVKRNDKDKFNRENIAAILGVKPEDLETTTLISSTMTTLVDDVAATTETLASDATTESTTLLSDTTTFETTLRQETTTDEQSTEATTNRHKQRDVNTERDFIEERGTEGGGRGGSGGADEEEGEAIFFKWSF